MAVLPLRSIGVSDTIIAVVGDLLQGELERRGVALVPSSRLAAEARGEDSECDEAPCAAEIAARLGAGRVVYGSLSRLGNKIFARVRVLRLGEETPYYADQITATTEEDLDAVVRRIAEGIVSGQERSDRPTVDTITEAETLKPRRRASRAAIGLRAGFILPDADSYGGVDRLTTLRLSCKYEARDFLVDLTPLLGFAWRGGTVEWSMLDVFGARILGTGDWAPYLGMGLGVHSVRVKKDVLKQYTAGGTVYSYPSSEEQSESTLTLDAGAGLLLLRTYDFMLVLDLRYHWVFADFDQLGGRGAHGLTLSFGTSR